MKKIIFGIMTTTTLILAGFFEASSSSVSGEAFLRTKGGSVITCAGSLVYIEKVEPEGYMYLTNTIKDRKEHLSLSNKSNYLENNEREEKLQKLEKSLKNGSYSKKRLQELEKSFKNGSLDTSGSIFIKKQLEQAESSNNTSNISYWKKRLENSPSGDPIKFKQQIEQAKERREKHLEEIRKLKVEKEKEESKESKKLLIVKKDISKLEEQLANTKKENTKETMCNSQGQFSFTGLSPDHYYISTTVEWFVGDKKQGGIVTKIVILNEGENKVFITK